MAGESRRFQSMVGGRLAAGGHEVVPAASPDEALSRLARGDISIVVCEVSAIDSAGIDLVRLIEREFPATATIVVTDGVDHALAALDAGAVAYLRTRFRPDELRLALHQALHCRRERLARRLEAHEQAHALRRQAELDQLTGVFNRHHFEDHLRAWLSAAAESSAAALLMCDLDHFKSINDSLGHVAGDGVLRRAAKILRSTVRRGDLVARFGGDEFVVLLTATDQAGALKVAEEVRRRMGEGHTRSTLSASIGVFAFGRNDGLAVEDLLEGADQALYEAKAAGRNCVVAYTGPRRASLSWIERIDQALEHRLLRLHSQPIVDLRTGSVASEELLIRMQGDGGELIPPASFLPTAERCGKIEEIDAWAVGQALNLASSGRPVSVNVSAKTLHTDRILRLLEERSSQGDDLSGLTLEVTETSAVTNVGLVSDLARRVNELGCRIALDDFGTGFGSFLYLKHLPISFIKIDRDFVRGMVASRSDQRMIKAIVYLARDAGQKTVAEGVEDIVALDLVRRLGVDYAQGFYLGRPSPLDSQAPSLSHGARRLFASAPQLSAA